MKRRALLQAGLAAALTPLGLRLHAAPGTDSRLLIVFLRGGYDAANVLIPVGSRFYYEARPTIAIPKDSALALDSDWGLHPALRDTLHALYLKGQAAFVPFAGTDDLSRSHFETQDSIELGLPAGRSDYSSGFLNRLVTVLASGRAIAFTDQQPLILRGEGSVANAGPRLVGRSGVGKRQSELIAEMYRETSLGAQVSNGFATRDQVMRDLGDEMTAASRNAINPRNFELQARRVARLLKSSYNVGFADIGGWDTHVGQGAAEGYLAQRLKELGLGIAALADELGPAWRNTVLVLISEFGRTLRENGNRGTDHGHGTVYWVIGGGVRGGRVAGEQARVERATLLQDRDYPVLNDYRELFGGLFSRLYGLSGGQIAKVFPDVQPRDLGLL